MTGLAACQPSGGSNIAQWQEYSIEPEIKTAVTEQRHAVYFATDDDRISDSESASLSSFARGLERSAAIRIRVDGHADMRGTNSYNSDLSLRRADSVAKMLRAVGLKNLNFEVAGFGEEDPASFGQNAESLALNRRVELIAESVSVNIDGCGSTDVDLSMNPSNVRDGQIGCSNLANLVGMVADRRDLLSSQEKANSSAGLPDPVGQYGAVDRYREREIPELPDNGGS